MKLYQFDFRATVTGYGVVEAKNLAEAKKKILSQDYDDIIDTYLGNIEEIVNIRQSKQYKE